MKIRLKAPLKVQVCSNKLPAMEKQRRIDQINSEAVGWKPDEAQRKTQCWEYSDDSHRNGDIKEKIILVRQTVSSTLDLLNLNDSTS